VDALIDGDTTDPLATNLGYLESSNFRALVPDEYEVALTTPGQPADVLLQDTVGTTPGDEFALNIIDSEGGPYGVLQNENRRSVITEGRLSIVVGAPENEMVSVWLGYPGDIDVDNGDYGNLAVNKAVPPVTTSRITRETGSTFVSVTITENGDDTDPTNDVNVLVFGPYEIDLAAGDVITLLLVPPPAGGTGTVEAIVFDDL
jgi:hypothetical protein